MTNPSKNVRMRNDRVLIKWEGGGGGMDASVQASMIRGLDHQHFCGLRYFYF